MSARFTLSVSGNIRWTKVKPSSFIPTVISRVITEANRLNTEITPKGATGELQNSFRAEQTERTVRFYWDAPYARFVDKGTQESPGRYVPILGKRLVSTKRRIGTHPGIKAQHFSQKMATALREVMVQSTVDEVRRSFR